jgi:DNA polymerase elongation subunit (family B)
LIASERGGLVGQPVVGIHHNVAEIDFFSMYPQIMAR